MFAFALWDAKAHRLVLGRDRVGIKPLYVARASAIGSSGARSRSACSPAGLDPQLDLQALHDYLTLGYVPGPASIFAGVDAAPAGHVLIARARARAPDGRAATGRSRGHVRAGPERRERGRVAGRAACGRCAGRSQSHLMTDVPLGVFLSGGVDSGTHRRPHARARRERRSAPSRSASRRRASTSPTRRARSRRATAPSTTS